MKDIADLYDSLVLKAIGKAGGNNGWALIGPNLQRAMAAQEILNFHQQMLGAIEAVKLVDAVSKLYAELIEQFPEV